MAPTYNISINEILIHLVKCVIQTDIDKDFITICKLIIHNKHISNNILVRLFIVKIKSFV